VSTAYEHKTQLVGDDYTGLPTQPVKYRGRRQGSSVDWDQIQADYIARGGQVDASVWPQHGKVVVITGNARSSRANLHTFVEAQDDEYAEPAEPPLKPRTKADYQRKPYRPNSKLTDEQRAEIRQRRANGETLTSLAAAYSVAVNTIVKTVKAARS
jgi:hypothetical protein